MAIPLESIIGDALAFIPGAPTFIFPGESASSIAAKLQTGGHVHFLAGTGYDLTSIANNTVIVGNLRVTGDGRDRVTVRVAADPAGAPGIANQCFAFRGSSFYMAGIKFVGERTPIGLQGLTTRVERFEIEDCWFENSSSIVNLDTITASAGTELGVVKINRNIGRNLNSGISLRLGDGSASGNFDIPIDYFEAMHNDLVTLDKYGIVCNYDQAATGYTYASGASFAKVIGNRIRDLEGRGGSTVTGFGINVCACRNVFIAGNYLEDVVKGVRTNIEPIYNKAPVATICLNEIVNCDGDQGAIALKSGTGGEQIHCYGNTIRAEAMAMLCGIWVQSYNANVHDNDLRGTFSNSAIRAGGEALANTRIANNNIYQDDGATGNYGIRIDVTTTNLRITGNHIRRLGGASGNYRFIDIELGAGEAVADPIVADNVLIKDAASGAQSLNGIELLPHASGPITDPQILRNHALDVNTFINLPTVACTGTVAILYNTEVGVTTDVSNGGASTLDNRFNSWS